VNWKEPISESSVDAEFSRDRFRSMNFWSESVICWRTGFTWSGTSASGPGKRKGKRKKSWNEFKIKN